MSAWTRRELGANVRVDGAYLHTGPESQFEQFGFTRDRRIAKWRWVMRLTVGGAEAVQEVMAGLAVPPAPGGWLT